MYAIPGGLIAVGTKVDPQFTRSDNMVGNIIGHPDSMPPVYIEIDVKTTMLRRVVGTRQDSNNKIDSLQEGETLLINIGSTSCGGNVMRVTGVSKTVCPCFFLGVSNLLFLALCRNKLAFCSQSSSARRSATKSHSVAKWTETSASSAGVRSRLATRSPISAEIPRDDLNRRPETRNLIYR